MVGYKHINTTDNDESSSCSFHGHHHRDNDDNNVPISWNHRKFEKKIDHFILI